MTCQPILQVLCAGILLDLVFNWICPGASAWLSGIGCFTLGYLFAWVDDLDVTTDDY